MLTSRHSNLKELLLGDLSNKVMCGVEDYDSMSRRFDAANAPVFALTSRRMSACTKKNVKLRRLSTKSPVNIAIAYIVGKTARSLKQRCQAHYQGLGKFYDKHKCFHTHLEERKPAPTSPLPISNQVG